MTRHPVAFCGSCHRRVRRLLVERDDVTAWYAFEVEEYGSVKRDADGEPVGHRCEG